jgi:hypothetical protein
MLSPGFSYSLYKENEKESLRQIEFEREAIARAGFNPARQPWFAQVAQWMNRRVFNHASTVSMAGKQVKLEEPC